MKKQITILIMVLSYFIAASQCTPTEILCHPSFQNYKRAIAEYTITYAGGSGSFTGTGFLINNTANDGRLFFVTVDYPFNGCVNSAFGNFIPGTSISSGGATISFKWDKEAATTCGASAPTMQTTSGATLRAIANGTALLELDTRPPFTSYPLLGYTTSTSTVHVCIGQVASTGIKKAIYTATGFTTTTGSINVVCPGVTTFNNTFSAPPRIDIDGWFNSAGPQFLSRGAPLIENTSFGKVEGVYYVGDAEGSCFSGHSFFTRTADIAGLSTFLGGSSNLNGIVFTPCPGGASQTLSGPLNTDLTVRVTNTIVSTQAIVNGNTVRYEAGTSVTLNPGFTSGDDFIAEIKPCNNSFVTLSKWDGVEGAAEEEVETTGNRVYANEVMIYPTISAPGGSVNLQFTYPESRVELTLVDVAGVEVKNYAPFSVLAASERIELPPSLSTGIYFLSLRSDNFNRTFKLLIQ